MANAYTDYPELRFHMQHELMKRIVELKERGYEDKDKYDYAPQNFEDAMDSYDKTLEIVGDVVSNVIAPNAEAVDAEGPHCENGRVRYASKTYENLDATIKAGMNGMTMPRRYQGLNLPITVYTAANEIISAGDAGFENIWSLQDCIETLYEFGDEDQRKRAHGIKTVVQEKAEFFQHLLLKEMRFIQDAYNVPALDTADDLDLFLELTFCVPPVEPGFKAKLVQKAGIKPARSEFGV